MGKIIVICVRSTDACFVRGKTPELTSHKNKLKMDSILAVRVCFVCFATPVRWETRKLYFFLLAERPGDSALNKFVKTRSPPSAAPAPPLSSNIIAGTPARLRTLKVLKGAAIKSRSSALVRLFPVNRSYIHGMHSHRQSRQQHSSII